LSFSFACRTNQIPVIFFRLRPARPDHHIAAASGAGLGIFYLELQMGLAPANAAHVVIGIF
jgi:hypothetical protein